MGCFGFDCKARVDAHDARSGGVGIGDVRGLVINTHTLLKVCVEVLGSGFRVAAQTSRRPHLEPETRSSQALHPNPYEL